MKIFVTGATGFIGSVLVQRLASSPTSIEVVYALVRRPWNTKLARIKPIQAEFEDASSYRNELLECDYVFHLAANASFDQKVDYTPINVGATKTLLECLRESKNLKNFIFVSTIGAVDREPSDPITLPLNIHSRSFPRSAYGRSKQEAEECVKKSGLPFTIIRPTWVYGPGMRANSHLNVFSEMVRRNHPVTRVAFPGEVTLIHVDDLAESLAHAIDNPSVIGKTYFAGFETVALGKIFGVLRQQVYGKPGFQFPMPRFRWFFARFHSKLPITVTNLFLPYLSADDPNFSKDFRSPAFKTLEQSAAELVGALPSPWWAITGANSGIGLALARELSKQGKKLFLIDKETDRLSEFDSNRHRIARADLTSRKDLQELAETLRELPLEGLINNAGAGFKGSFEDLSLDHLDLMIDLNCKAPAILTRQLQDSLIKNHTTIVNVASSVAYNPLPKMAVYAASKSFLASWSQALSYEWRKTNRVVTISPSGTRTNFQSSAGVTETRDLASPDEVARRILKHAFGSSKHVLLGGKSRLLVFLSRFMPAECKVRLWGVLFERSR